MVAARNIPQIRRGEVIVVPTPIFSRVRTRRLESADSQARALPRMKRHESGGRVRTETAVQKKKAGEPAKT